MLASLSAARSFPAFLRQSSHHLALHLIDALYLLLRKEGAVALVVFLPQGENLLAALKAVGDDLLRLRIGIVTFSVLFHTWPECPHLLQKVAIGTDKLTGRSVVESELAGDIIGLRLCKLFARHALMMAALRLVVLCIDRDAAQGHHEDSQRESDDMLHFLLSHIISSEGGAETSTPA